MSTEAFEIPSHLPPEYSRQVQETIHAMADHVEGRGSRYLLQIILFTYWNIQFRKLIIHFSPL